MVETTLLTVPINHINKLLEPRGRNIFKGAKSNQVPFKISIYTILEFHLYWKKDVLVFIAADTQPQKYIWTNEHKLPSGKAQGKVEVKNSVLCTAYW